jgi:4-alpha-glucanotransferase
LATEKLSIASPDKADRKPMVAKAPPKKTTKKLVGNDSANNVLPAGAKTVSKQAILKKEKKQAAVSKTDKQQKGGEKKETAGKKQTGAKKQKTGLLRKVVFQIHFHTSFGQDLLICGDHPLLGNGCVETAVPMQYFNDAYWYLVLDLEEKDLLNKEFTYHYILRNQDGILHYDWGNDKKINLFTITTEELLLIDTWNHAGYFENCFYTEPFSEVLLKENFTPNKTRVPAKTTHVLKAKAPLLLKGQVLALLGSGETFGKWDTSKPLLMGREKNADFYSLALDLSKELFPVAYKYGVYDLEKKEWVRYEDGDNRVLHDTGKDKRQLIVNDGFAVLPNTNWKAAGIAIPVFGLRSEKSFGVGEFTDLHLLVDWAARTGLKMIQLLPVNDTTATNTWVDSYPYAAISAFALHPMYLNLEKITDGAGRKRLQKMEPERQRLNALPKLDYEAVTKIKRSFVEKLYTETGNRIFASVAYKDYYQKNKHWLVPYAAFCYLRDQYGTVDFNRWPAYKKFVPKEIDELTAEGSEAATAIGLHYFIQFHLHQQLQEAASYAHSRGIIVKGDIAIGVYRNGADAWQDPSLYHLDFQAGAPPDDFAVKGQNWGFPTYHWEKMRNDGFAWWKQRFAQMSDYFDAFRIDHILGFFRIWSIPMHAVEGIMGHFVPAIPVHINEFTSQGIWFDYARYTKPYITEDVLWQVFGYDNELVKSLFLQKESDGQFSLKPAFTTQRLVEQHFETLEQDAHHAKIKQGLYDLISNVILFEETDSNGLQYHFRFGMEDTTSFQHLEWGLQQQLKALYINYFFRRQDEFWKKEALQKLPALKRETNMLVCGEDLGLVPDCVPDVMRQLGLLSLEIQRMPKDATKEFFHPNDAPYLSVVTPSTHDMSTIRGWWEENREQTQKFYNRELGQWGDAPVHCEAWINKAIVMQHLYSPAMWSIFQLQDLLGMDENLRYGNPADERINIPANPKHYWQYRMHLTLEELLAADAFNEELKTAVSESGRSEQIR